MKYLPALMLGWWLLSAPLDEHGQPNARAPLATWQAVVEMSTQPQCWAVVHDTGGVLGHDHKSLDRRYRCVRSDDRKLVPHLDGF
jgi:hypothetical protein